ncbi:MAG: Uma2 family endonuclease [Chloroflexales bacterium]|nr:Uma2 family endonuclease [Chloroflexales bacterium]
MTTYAVPETQKEIVYPESDGQPMADNTKQFRWIVTIEGGLEACFAQNSDVFVAGDLLWYPVEGQPAIRTAPDALVVFGRPKGDRGSYQQWREDNIPPQVVFEVLSPGNRPADLIKKFLFYERYGVEEYYIYDPDRGLLDGWLRAGAELQAIETMDGWISPRLGIRFALRDGDLELYDPDGNKFAGYIELIQQREQTRQQAEQARQQAEQARQQAEEERSERERAAARAERLAAQLRAMGVDPDQ